jgi:hypothetical protein
MDTEAVARATKVRVSLSLVPEHWNTAVVFAKPFTGRPQGRRVCWTIIRLDRR